MSSPIAALYAILTTLLIVDFAEDYRGIDSGAARNGRRERERRPFWFR